MEYPYYGCSPVDALDGSVLLKVWDSNDTDGIGELCSFVDPLAKRYGIRLILVDRPGVGATPSVDLADRIDISCSK